MKRFNLFNLFNLLTVCCASAQIQEAWVAHYNGGALSRTNKAVAIAVDQSGNIIVAGSSSGIGTGFDYVTIKYTPTGTGLWTNRYASPGNANDEVRGMAVDKDGNIYVTGTSVTVKYSSGGVPMWTAPYGGRAVALDTNGNPHVTGFSETDFATVKLDTRGSNVWLRTYDRAACKDVSHVITVDTAGNVYIAGMSQDMCGGPGTTYSMFRVIKYDPNGLQLWITNAPNLQQFQQSTVKGIGVNQSTEDVYITGNSYGDYQTFATTKYDNNGNRQWGYYLQSADTSTGLGVQSMTLDETGFIYLTGSWASMEGRQYGTVKLSPAGTNVWFRQYGGLGGHAASSLALNGVANVYVTGSSSPMGIPNDFATIKYDTNGNEKWTKRYDGPAHGDDQATALAVDTNSGAVYVTGFSQNTNGWYDLTTIKYSFLQNIQLLTNGYAFLQFFGTPGTNYRFQGSINLSNWVDIGSNVADTNGIYRFEDTNSPAFPHRFYRTVTP